MREFETFTRDVLIPKANAVLLHYYNAYCAGEDIDVQSKVDASPASMADREAEKELRALINARYPDHGIWGEEFGGENLDAEYVWVLDPLDGTKQFLAKQEGCFVVLIGLYKNKRAYMGAASDPLSQQIWLNNTGSISSNRNDEKMIVASTAPELMFRDHPYKYGVESVLMKADDVVEYRNAKSFLDVVEGAADVAIEARLSLHDIGALIPILKKSGCIATDFDGIRYQDKTFDFNEDKYDLLVTRNQEITNKMIESIRG